MSEGNMLGTASLQNLYDEMGPHGAVLGMQIAGSGLGHNNVDIEYVREFSRQRMRGCDIPTSLGAAVSFSDAGYQVRFIGLPSPSAQKYSRENVEKWAGLLSERGWASLEERRPTAEDIDELFADDGPAWSVQLHLPGQALGRKDIAIQPTYVLGRHGRTLLNVYSPGGAEGVGENEQEVKIFRALGGLSIHHTKANQDRLLRRISLLAVRPRSWYPAPKKK